MINIFVVFDIYKPVLKSFISKHELNEYSYDQIIDKLGEFSISTGYSWYKNLHLNYSQINFYNWTIALAYREKTSINPEIICYSKNF